MTYTYGESKTNDQAFESLSKHVAKLTASHAALQAEVLRLTQEQAERHPRPTLQHRTIGYELLKARIYREEHFPHETAEYRNRRLREAAAEHYWHTRKKSLQAKELEHAE